jgi:hypothetical protein
LLADGRVLIAGGIAAEIYDPRTNTFSLTGTPMKFPNGVMTTLPPWGDPSKAVLLLVLFSGGGDWGPDTSAWVYNPSTGTFAATGGMNMPRAEDTTTLLPDGTVLAAGSFKVGGYLAPNPGALGTAELYDPAPGAFSTVPDMTIPRFDHTATLLTNDKVLITGGTTGMYIYPGYSYLSSTEIYNPAVLVPGPALLSLSGGQGAILHAGTSRVVSSFDPAVTGEILEIYCACLIDGSVIPPQVAIGGHMAEVLFFGKAPGFAGLNQVNVRVPSGIAPGDSVPVRLTYLGRPSNEVTIGVQ